MKRALAPLIVGSDIVALGPYPHIYIRIGFAVSEASGNDSKTDIAPRYLLSCPDIRVGVLKRYNYSATESLIDDP